MQRHISLCSILSACRVSLVPLQRPLPHTLCDCGSVCGCSAVSVLCFSPSSDALTPSTHTPLSITATHCYCVLFLSSSSISSVLLHTNITHPLSLTHCHTSDDQQDTHRLLFILHTHPESAHFFLFLKPLHSLYPRHSIMVSSTTGPAIFTSHTLAIFTK